MKRIHYLIFLLSISTMMLVGCKDTSINANVAGQSTPSSEEANEQVSSSDIQTTDDSNSKTASTTVTESESPSATVEQESDQDKKSVKEQAENIALQKQDQISATDKNQIKETGTKTETEKTSEPAKAEDANKQNKPESTKPVEKVPEIEKESEQKDTVTVTVYGDGQTILSATDIKFTEGMTVFEALKKVLKDSKIQMEYNGQGKAIYIEGINNLYEFDKGPGSGWIFKVNGSCPSESCSAYTLQKGDSVNWYYTLDFGKDIG